ncbi:hypothetical protein [Brevibacillus migulae]|uniref:hypothetical protein n=1 Tax=Brevibacillus migulae TaxID=1644114 RepID=UPI00106E2239|nr:hypothetical protein [Brevibacillus migulae]
MSLYAGVKRMFWFFLFSPVVLMLAAAYMVDQKRRKTYRIDQFDHSAKHHAQTAMEAEAITRTLMDPP